MVISKVLKIAVVVLALGGLCFYLFPGREKRVKKQLNRLTEYCQKRKDEPPLLTLKKSAQIGGLFADSCALVVTRPHLSGVFSRKEIMDRVTMVRRVFLRLDIELYDISIDFPEDETAEVLLTMRIAGIMGSKKMAEVREVDLNLQRQDGEWLFTRFELVDPLER